MPKYKNVLTGRVVIRPVEYISAYPDGRFVPVEDDTEVFVEPCCGAVDDEYESIESYEGFEDKE